MANMEQLQKRIGGKKIQEVVPKELFDTKVLTITGGLAGITVPTPVLNFYDTPQAGDLLTNIKQSRQLSNEHFFVRDIQARIVVESMNIDATIPAAPGDLHYFVPPYGSTFADKTLVGFHPPYSAAMQQLFSSMAEDMYGTSIFQVLVNQTEFLECPAWRLTTPNATGPGYNAPTKSQEGGLIMPEDLYFKPNDSFTMRLQLNQTLLQGAFYLAYLSWVQNVMVGAIGLSDGAAPPALVYNPNTPLSVLTQCDVEFGISIVLCCRGVVARTIR